FSRDWSSDVCSSDLQRLVLGTGRHPPLARQVAEEAFHFRAAHLARMPPAVGLDIAANPVQIRLLGTQAVMLHPQTAPNFVQQPWPFRLGSHAGYGCSAAVILHMDVSTPDNALNVSCSQPRAHRHKPLIPIGKA